METKTKSLARNQIIFASREQHAYVVCIALFVLRVRRRKKIKNSICDRGFPAPAFMNYVWELNFKFNLKAALRTHVFQFFPSQMLGDFCVSGNHFPVFQYNLVSSFPW